MPSHFIGIDSGVKGGGGLCVLVAENGVLHVVEGVEIPRGSAEPEIAMIVKTASLVAQKIEQYQPLVVAREDHNFLGQIERFSRNVLRRINGAIDYVLCRNPGHGHACYTPGEDYLAFPPGSWKAVAGIPGDIGKAVKGQSKGRRTQRFKKAEKGTASEYLDRINEILGSSWTSSDVADAHGIAVAAARVYGARRGVFQHVETYESRVLDALWDKGKCLGKTRAAFEKATLGAGMDPVEYRRRFGQFVRTFSP